MERSLTIRRELAAAGGNANHEQKALARSIQDGGWNLMESNHFVDAERCLREALAIYTANNIRDARVIEAHFTLQMSLDGQGRMTDAVAVANEALALGREHFPEGDAELANVLHFLAGEKHALRDLPAAEGDKRQEPNEAFVLNLSGASGATISDNQGVGTILNDDGGGGKGKLAAALLVDDWLTTRKRK